MNAQQRKQGTFCWEELGTRDVAAAKKFYSGLFGWKLRDESMGEMGTYTLIDANKHEIGGMYQMSGPQFEGVPSHWLVYVTAADVDASAAKAQQLGGQILMPPMDIPEVGRMACLKDPQGAAFAIFKDKGHEGSAAAPRDQPQLFCWRELMTQDTAGAKKFYSALLGWQFQDQQMGPINYTLVMNGAPQPEGGMMAMSGPEWAGVPSHWMSYVAVKDCDGDAKKAEKLGGKVCVPPTDVPGVGRFAVLTDPAGATLSIIKMNAQ